MIPRPIRFDFKTGQWIEPSPYCEYGSEFAIYAAVATTVLSTAAAVYAQQQQASLAEAQGQAAANAAKEQANAANNQAIQLNQMAGQDRAAAQQAAKEKLLQGALAQSRGAAVASASGGTSTDPGVVTLQGETGARSEYNALSDLYTGESRAKQEDYQATLDRVSGQQSLAAGQFAQSSANFRAGLMPVQSAGTIFGNASSLFSRYGLGSKTPGLSGGAVIPSDPSYPGYG